MKNWKMALELTGILGMFFGPLVFCLLFGDRVCPPVEAQPRPQWEYRVVHDSSFTPNDSVARQLNELGAQGFEVVGADENSLWVLKRRK